MEEGVKSKIIYCSRTFSQLSQVTRELRRTIYVPKCITLASKDKLCANPCLVSQKDDSKSLFGSALRMECKNLRKNNGCQFFANHQKEDKSYPEESLDIEELGSVAQKLMVCPYYHNKRQQQTADIVMMPYNYIMSSQLRKNMEIELKDSILIIDEAHNISQAAEDALSFEINTDHLKKIGYELTYLLSKVDPRLHGQIKASLQFQQIPIDRSSCSKKDKLKSAGHEIAAVLVMIINFQKFLTDVKFKDSQSTEGFSFTTKHMRELQDRCWILSGSKTKDFMSQFKMGTNFKDEGIEHPIFQSDSKTLKKLGCILDDLMQVTKTSNPLFQMWFDLWESILTSEYHPSAETTSAEKEKT
jgi:Rad3-related DNA helicase